MGHRLVEVGASPWLWISNTYAVIICCLALLLRSLIRVRDYGLDDFLHALACILALAAFGSVYRALEEGLGTLGSPLSETMFVRIARLVINSSCLSFAADGCLKLSTMAILYKVHCGHALRSKQHLTAFAVLSSLIILWMFLSVCLWATRCSTNDHISHPRSKICGDAETALKAIVGISASIELGVFTLSSWLLWRLNMKLYMKTQVAIIFALRLPLIIFYVCFSTSFEAYLARRHSPVIIYGSGLYWQTFLLGYSILATTIQPLKRAANNMSTRSDMAAGLYVQSAISKKYSGTRTPTRDQVLDSDAVELSLQGPSRPMAAQDLVRQDAESIESHGSQDRIVKHTLYQVSYSH